MRASIYINAVRYTVADLRSAPEDAAVFFLMLGQFHNQMAALKRQIVQSTLSFADNEPEVRTRSAASVLAARMLASHLWEGWLLLKGKFGAELLAQTAEAGELVVQEYQALRKMFGAGTLLNKIRNTAAYHYDRGHVIEAYRAMHDADELVDYHESQPGNCLFYSAEAVLVKQLSRLDGSEAGDDLLSPLYSEIMQACSIFDEITRQYIRTFCAIYLPGKDKEDFIEVPDQPTLEEFSAPVYLAATPSEARKAVWRDVTNLSDPKTTH